MLSDVVGEMRYLRDIVSLTCQDYATPVIDVFFSASSSDLILIILRRRRCGRVAVELECNIRTCRSPALLLVSIIRPVVIRIILKLRPTRSCLRHDDI